MDLIETIRLEFYKKNNMELGEFAQKVEVSHNTITNIFKQKNSPTLPTFLKMLEVLELKIKFKSELDLPPTPNIMNDNMLMFYWRNAVMTYYADQITIHKLTDDQIQNVVAGMTNKPKRTIQEYWDGEKMPRLDTLIELFSAIQVEIELKNIDKFKNPNQMRPNFIKTFELSKKQFRLLYNEFKARNKGNYTSKDMPKFKDLWETHSNNDKIVLDVETRRSMDCLFFVGLDDDHFLTEFLENLN